MQHDLTAATERDDRTPSLARLAAYFLLVVRPSKSHDNSIRIIMRITRPALLVLLLSATALAKPEVAKAVKLPLPGGEGGIGFDDLMFSPTLHRVLAPAAADNEDFHRDLRFPIYDL